MTNIPDWTTDPEWPTDDPTTPQSEDTPETMGEAGNDATPEREPPPELFFGSTDEFVREFVCPSSAATSAKPDAPNTAGQPAGGNPPKPSSASKPCGDPGNTTDSTPPPASAPGSATTPTTTSPFS